MTYETFLLRLAVAFAAGFTIGFERQWRQKAAGLRTNTLAAVGSALFVLLSFMITRPNEDVTRIVAQVVTGIGFIGAGIVFKDRLNVHGLTTAVTVWCSSAIGCLAGAGFIVEVAIATGFILLINFGLKPIDRWLNDRKHEKDPPLR